MTTWILLRGLTRGTGHWGDFLPRFQQAFVNDSLLPLDFPGNGALHLQQSPTTVQAMVEHCRQQLADLGLQPPYRIVALSMGAMVAVAWAHDYPQEISHQVLINTSLRPINPFYQRLRPGNYPRLLRLMLGGTDARHWEQTLWHMTSRRSPPDTVDGWVRLRQQHPVKPFNAMRQLWAASRFVAPPTPPKTPTLLLASTSDGLVSVECSRSIARQWKWPLLEHPQAGHDLPLDDGPWVVDQILNWQSVLANEPASAVIPDRC
jgi:pimeloyl-ACP methyl ester carboxylesterase